MTQFAAGLFAPNASPAGYGEMLKAFAVRPSHFHAHADDLKHLRDGLRRQSAHYSEIPVPVVILVGADDKIDPPETQAMPLQQALVDAKLVTVSGSGHTVHHENPALVLAALEQVQRKEQMRNKRTNDDRDVQSGGK